MENNAHPTLKNGKICYVELPATDVGRSAFFYKNIFGWHIRQRGDGSVSFDDSTGQVSGTWVTNRTPATDPGLLIHIMVDDIKATIGLITGNGGKIVQPVGKDDPEITAHFSDPAGNILGLYQEPG